MKKKLLIVLCVVLATAAIVTASVAGTIAYMTYASKVTNVFTIGDVFITLDESTVDIHGVPIAGAARTDRNSYHLMPGDTYVKDPAITVAEGTALCYLFLVTRNHIADIEANHDGLHDETPTMAEQMYKNGWAIYKDTTAGSRVWVYCGLDENGEPNVTNKYGQEGYTYTPMAICGKNSAPSTPNPLIYVADPAVRIPVFEQFTIRADDSEKVKLYGGAEVSLNAVAIQASDNFGDLCSSTAIDNAWKAIVAQFPYIEDNISSSGN